MGQENKGQEEFPESRSGKLVTYTAEETVEAMKELFKQFEKTTGHKVVIVENKK